MLKLYNTESREKELLPGEEIKMYTCGPTVYDFAHIGNFRTYVFEDLLRRTLKFFGHKVTQVMNITDVDDKTIRGAVKKGVTLADYTKPYTDAFFEDLKALNIEPVEVYPRATDHIPEMITMIETLLEKGIAYKGADGSIYYSIDHFPTYGRLSHLNLEELQKTERSSSDEYEKESLSDFVLWKAYDKERDGEVFWESPFGLGRPGWHLECSAMAIKHLGPSIDIHCGGVDNMFPHHENEIAQSEACTGQCFSKLWLHSEHLLVDNKKMSKSLGNFYTLRDLLEKGYTGREVRYLLLQTHYKTQLNFTFKGLDAARSSLARLDSFVERLQKVESEGKGDAPSLEAFKEALADDLNISEALAVLFDLVRETNSRIDQNLVGKAEAEAILESLQEIDRVFGLLSFEQESFAIPEEVLEALEKREAARAAKNWSDADFYRDKIQASGYKIVDTPTGPEVKKL